MYSRDLLVEPDIGHAILWVVKYKLVCENGLSGKKEDRQKVRCEYWE